MTFFFEHFFMASEKRLCILDPNGYILVVNAAFSDTLLYTVADLVHKPFKDLVLESHCQNFSKQIKNEKSENLLLPIRKSDNEYQDFYWNHKFVNGYLHASLDTKPYFEDDYSKNNHQNILFDNGLADKNSSEGLWDWDLEKNTMYYSPQWKAMLGYTDEELNNDVTTWKNCIYEDDLPITLQLIEYFNTGKLPNFEIVQRFYHKNYSTVYVYCKAIHFKNLENKVIRMIGVVRDITAQKIVEEKQRKNERILSKAQELVSMGSWEWDMIENKVAWSDYLYKLLGFEIDEFMPEPESFLQYVHADDKSRVLTMMWRCLNMRKPETIECKVIKKDKTIIFVRCEGYLEYNSSNVLLRAIGVIWDITEQKKNEQELIKAKEIAENSVKLKEQFISTMSHEIRTPMNAVMGMTNLLLQENPQSHQTDYLKVLHSASKNLLLLINDILDFSKIEAGKIIFESIDFNLQELLNNIVDIYSYSAKEKGLYLELNYHTPINTLLVGDPIKLTQIITNLVGNAIKFTEKGNIIIQVNIEKEFENQLNINFSVIDTGIGIPKERLENIFESFTQAATDTTRKYGGTGLGLTIARNLVELQGGKIGVKSVLNEGATFSFTLPFPKSKLPFLSQEKTVFMPESLEGVKILVAEDNETNRFVISRFLENWKIDYDFAANGLETVAKIQQKYYDMVFMDLHMPELDGYEATREIRQLVGTYYQTVPILALTASALSSVGARIKEFGMDDFLLKPFDPKELYQKIAKYALNKIIEFTNTAQDLSKSSTQNSTKIADKVPVEISHIDFSKFEIITMGEKKFGGELLQLYVNQLEEYIIDLQILVKNQQLAEIHSLNHKIKSTVMILQLQENLYKEQLLLEEFIAKKDAKQSNIHFQSIAGFCKNINLLLSKKIQVMKG